jgi:uncharacterized membrane protein
MEKFWNIFWKLFGISLLLILAVGIIMGIVSHSAAAVYGMIQKTIAAGFGICGFIGLLVVPVEMFFEHRVKGGESEDAVD